MSQTIKWEGMLQRTATGLVIVVTSALVVFLAPLPPVLPLITLAVNLAAVFELIRAAHLTQERVFLFGTMALAGVISILPIPMYQDVMMGILPVSALVFFHIMHRNSRCVLDTKPRTGCICLLVVLLLRAIPELDGPHLGISLLVCYATDAFAYLGGVAFGKRKLCPRISPNKTVEGSICGILGAVAAALLLSPFRKTHLALLILYAVCTSIVGQFGDLAISGVKRAFAIKDLGNILPGHGGILDRFDSHTFAIPFTLLFCRIVGSLF